MDRRMQILTAAVRVFADQGFNAASVDQVAAEAGVAVGSIYTYFKGKDELLKEIIRGEFAKRQRFLAAVNMKAPLVDRVMQFVTMHLEDVAQNPQTAQLVLQEKRLVVLWQRAGEVPAKGIADMLEHLLGGDVTFAPIPTVAVLLQGMLEGITQRLVLTDQFHSQEQLPTILSAVRYFVTIGL